jgi:hypothetical protein
LKDTTKTFTEGAEQIRQRAMAWRLGKIRNWRNTELFGGRAPGGHTVYHLTDDLCGWDRFAPKEWQLPDRRSVVQAGFGRDLDAILAPTRQWGRLAEQASPRLASKADRRGPTEGPAPAAGSIVPCSESEDAAVRDVTTEAGTKCRRDAIDKYLAALDIVKGRYNAGTLRACLNELRRELGSDAGHEGCGSQLAAGACYYRKLGKCLEKARLDGDALALSAANADDPENSDDPAGAGQADCDGRCAADQVRRFMLSNPEPAGAKRGTPKRARTKASPEPDDTEDN